MLSDQIFTLRNKLNNMLAEDTDYKQIYAVSIELDKLIVEYHNSDRKMKKKSNSSNRK